MVRIKQPVKFWTDWNRREGQEDTLQVGVKHTADNVGASIDVQSKPVHIPSKLKTI